MGAFTSESVKENSPKCWLPLSHMEALISCPDTFLASICDTDPTLLREAKDKYDIDNYFNDHLEMLKIIKPELVCVATRTMERTGIIKDAINAGVKAVHLEKPICNSMEQLEELSKLTTEKNISLTYGTIRRYLRIYKIAKDILDSNELGDLHQIEVNFGPAKLFWAHPHSVDIILFFAGQRQLTSVKANLSDVVLSNEKELISSDPLVQNADLYFDDGCLGKISSNLGMDVILSCSKGRISIQADGKRIVVQDLDKSRAYLNYPGKVIKLEDGKPEGTMAAIECLVKQLRHGTNSSNESFDFDKKHIFTSQLALFGFVQSHIDGGLLTPIDKIRPTINILARSGKLYA